MKKDKDIEKSFEYIESFLSSSKNGLIKQI